MLKPINLALKNRNWKAQWVWEWENKIIIPELINRIESKYYQTQEVTLDLEIFNLRTDNFTCSTLFEFLVHYRLTQEANLKYPVIINNEWQVIDWRHRICKAILQWKKSIKWIQILDSNVI